MAPSTVAEFNEQVDPRTLLVAVGLFICSTVFVLLVPSVDFLVAVLRWKYLAVGLLLLSAVVAARDT